MLSMKLDELKIPPKDDYTNILLIEEKGLIDKDTSSILSANGLRNRLVYNYNKISDKLALESIKTLLPKLAKIRKDLESWTST